MEAIAARGRTGLLDTYLRDGLDQLSDVELVGHVARVLAQPRYEPADSFVLHAPLELVARAALLPSVTPDRRLDARLRLLALAESFEAWGTPAPPTAAQDFDSPRDAADVLIGAIRWGELDDVDAAARWLGRAVPASELARLLAEPVAPLLGAAAHASIFLYHLPRVAPREGYGELLRGLARELARNGTWRLQWLDERSSRAPAEPDGLFAALAATPHLGVPGSTFIYPLMSQVDRDLAPRLLAGVTGGASPELARTLLTAAAWSMLLEPPDHAPYGWSHCLTMPQAVLGLAGCFHDPSDALAVAATYLVGFRAALAQRPLEPAVPIDPRVTLAEAIAAGPTVAAGAAWHAPSSSERDIITILATNAATAHDAHLVKYTLACLDAAADDPPNRRLFLAAAASLAGWWAVHGDPDDAFADPDER